MNGRKRGLAWLVGCTMLVPLLAQPGDKWEMTADSLFLYSGKTYCYTVDTPEEGGLTSTLIKIPSLLQSLGREGEIYQLVDADGMIKTEGYPVDGDRLEKVSATGQLIKSRVIAIREVALPPKLYLHKSVVTAGVSQEIKVDFFAGQRTPMAQVDISIPPGIEVTLDNTTVNVIGRGTVILRDLSKQSIGRTGLNYSYSKVGEVVLRNEGARGTVISFSGLDLRPANGADISLTIKGAKVPEKGEYVFKASYMTSQPQILKSPVRSTVLRAENILADFARVPLRRANYKAEQDFSWTTFQWTPVKGTSSVTLMASTDKGDTWQEMPDKVVIEDGFMTVTRLKTDRLYAFKLRVNDGPYKGESNIAWFYSGKINVKNCGVSGNGETDDTEKINELIAYANRLGGGTILFPKGKYNVRTLHLKSNVWLYVDKDAVISALPGADAPESTWFSDRAYRSGLSPTDSRPYKDPENYLTKQDVGHTFFRNSMFFGERIENVKIVGTGRITGNGNIVTTDKVMDNVPERRCDKMFTFKLCKDIEIGGLDIHKDMWYDPDRDIPYYIEGDTHLYDDSNMLHIDQGGHFVLLATGTDGINVHDTYFAKYDTSNARDIYDFMGCNDVRVMNIYSKVSSDDIVKPGSDCSLGFTRPASNYWVRNVVGDTNCNLFQIGSETADDIQNLYIDNIYVLGANKAGFSISTNDGGHVKNVYLNSGKTGPLHSRSVMCRTRAPFFISISNRGRVLGANVEMFTFEENGKERKELLVTNSNIGQVENIYINGVDISDVYGGSSFRSERWKPYDGSQNEAAAIIAGFKLPDSTAVKGGLTFRMPDGRHTAYIKNIRFRDVNLTVKGGHPVKDALSCPPEIGVGRYNVGDLKVLPAFGFWLRHVDGLIMEECTVQAEKADGRHAVYLDDVLDAAVSKLKIYDNMSGKQPLKSIRCRNVTLDGVKVK